MAEMAGPLAGGCEKKWRPSDFGERGRLTSTAAPAGGNRADAGEANVRWRSELVRRTGR